MFGSLFLVGLAVAVQALGSFQAIKFMPLASTETEGDQNGE